MKVTPLFTLILVLSLSIPGFHSATSTQTNREIKRAEELFLSGARAISEKHFDQGRILLNTMINTYTESPLREQAKLLVFYSFAQEGGPTNEKAAMLLNAMEEEMKAYEERSRIH